MDYLKSTALVFAAQNFGATWGYSGKNILPLQCGVINLCGMNHYESFYIGHISPCKNHCLNKCTTEAFTEKPQPQMMGG